jgi:hypothetical protein
VYAWLTCRSGRFVWFEKEGKARQERDDINVLFTQAAMVRLFVCVCGLEKGSFVLWLDCVCIYIYECALFWEGGEGKAGAG